MKPNGVIKRLERLSFEALPEWDGTYKIRINRSISGLPAEIAHGLTEALNEAVTRIRLLVKAQINKPLAEAQLALALPGVCPECGSEVVNNVCQNTACKGGLL